jgi:hypothetical protein
MQREQVERKKERKKYANSRRHPAYYRRELQG